MKIKDGVLLDVDDDTDIKDGTFAVPESVTSIGGCAFCGCPSLTRVIIGNNVTSIGFEALGNCRSLTSVEIPNSVTSIGNGAFYYCTSLTSIVIPDSVTIIGGNAFYNCSSLTSVYYKGTADDWSKITIGSGNDNLTSATRYYYSETQPTEEGNFWHYVNDIPTVWGMDFKNKFEEMENKTTELFLQQAIEVLDDYIGKTVYMLIKDEEEFAKIIIRKGTIHKIQRCGRLSYSLIVNCFNKQGDNLDICFYAHEIGTRVFLSKESAKQARIGRYHLLLKEAQDGKED